MAKVTGFLDYARQDPVKEQVESRLAHWREFETPLSVSELETQAARCMDCGIPYCHAYGCPVKNRIPDWCDMVYRGRWEDALRLLHSTDNLPEMTGRVCPAPCESACTLSINQPSVSIRNIERQIIERGFAEGWVVPEPPEVKSGKRVAVVGSGPSGLAAAQQIARAGHEVVVFEKSDRVGGLLRYGIPDFKLEKWVIDRRMEQMMAEGVTFETEVDAGVDMSARFMMRSFDAIVITAGAGVPRDLPVPGRELSGVHFAMEFLTQSNHRVAGDTVPEADAILATGKNVVVIGGGDTGSDCVGTSNRQGAKSVTQIELLPKPPDARVPTNPWPEWPGTLRTSTSHDEGCARRWSIATQSLEGKDGRVTKLNGIELEWSQGENGRPSFSEIAGSEFALDADLVLLAMGFVHVEHGPLVKDLDLALDPRGNLVVDENFMTSAPGVFAAGDSVTGASLVVRVIHWGRLAAAGVNRYLASQ